MREGREGDDHALFTARNCSFPRDDSGIELKVEPGIEGKFLFWFNEPVMAVMG